MKTPPNKHKYILILSILFLAILIAFGGYHFYKKERERITAEKHSDLKAISQLKVDQLVQWHKGRLSEAIFFSNNKPFVQSTLELISGDTSSEEYLRTSLTHIQSNNRYENIFILTPSGKLIFNLDNSFVIVDTITVSRSKQAITKNEILFTDFYYCPTHNSTHFDIIAPLLNPKGVVFATLVFRVDPEDYLFPLIQNWPTPSKTAETLLVRKEGESVVFINTLRHVDDPPLTLRIPLSMVEVPAVKAIHGLEGLYEGIDYRGHRVLSVISAVPNTPWFMIAKVDRDEIFSVLYYRTGFIITITVLLIIASGAILAWFYHYRQRNIYRQLLESEKELHQSQEEFRATLYSIGDGVITTDKQGIIKQMNPVAESLTGWVEAEARGKKLEEVFKIINEKTRNKVESPVELVLKEGAIVGLANHTLLISKTGKEIPIADSGAPIKNKKGEVEGVVMVFRDQSEEREQQNVIMESDKQHKALISQMQLGIAVHEMIFNANNVPIDFRFLNVNEAFEKLTGLNKDEILGKNVLEVLPNTEPVWIERYGQVIQTGEPINFENYAAELGKYFSVKAYKSQANQFAVLIEDITQRKRDEAELIEREVQYRNLANSSQALIWTSGVDKLCNYFNETWFKFTGRTFEQELGNGWAEGVHPDDFDRCLETYVTAFDKHEPFEMEYRLRHVSGDYRIILDLGTPNFNTKGEFIGYIGHCFDITDRKKTEQDLIELKNELEAKVNEKTKELNERIAELERFHEATIDRELRMKELREEIKRLKEEKSN